MKILLTNSPFQYYHTTAFFHPDWGALNLAQLAAMVDTPENQIEILDNWHFWFKSEEIIKAVERFKPDLVGISNSTDVDTESVLEIARKIKKRHPDIILISGGEAATAKFDYLLKEGFDIIVLGEGEFTLRELVAALNRKEKDLRGIGGLAFKIDDQIIETAERSFIKNLDDLPFPARQYQKRLKSIFFPGRYSSEIETARGCPYACDYCSVTAFWKRTLRKKTNPRIIEELKEIKYKFGATQVYFVDDVFGINADEYSQLFKIMLDERLDFKWFTQIRPDTIANNPEMIELAAKSGMFGALVGFETYDEKILKGVGKIGSRGINEKAAELFRKNKIVIFGVHMFNIPGQSTRDCYLTYKYGSRNSDIFRLSMFSPIPGTPIFERFKKEGKVKAHDEKRYPYAYSVIDKNVDSRKIKFLYYWYFLLVYLSPKNIIGTFLNRDRLMRRMKMQAYMTNFRYVFYLFLRNLRLKIL
jgi:anaerobic magnesium-protoporphyrin IX monomethyl ester cyclase